MELFEKTLGDNTPYVKLDPFLGTIILIGKSIPEYSPDFYDPIINWVKEYRLRPKKNTVITLKLDYMNSSSSRYIFELLCLMATSGFDDYNLDITWFYDWDDDDIANTIGIYETLIHKRINRVLLD